MTVSVVIPTYNSAQFIEQTLQSVQRQTLTDWEALIIDGGSTDETAAIVARYAKADPRFSWHCRHGGVAVSRNAGVQMARYPYVAFLDSDDIWMPERLSALVDPLNRDPQLAISYSRAEFVHFDGASMGTVSTNRVQGVRPEHFLAINPTITMSNIVVRREVAAAIPMDETMSYSEDIEWIFRLMVTGGWAVAGLDQVLLQYRINPNGLSAQLYQMEAGWEQFVAAARKIAPDLVQQHYATARAAQLRYLARRSLRLRVAPTVSADFLTRALRSDWTLLLKAPKTAALALVVYGRALTTLGNPHHVTP